MIEVYFHSVPSIPDCEMLTSPYQPRCPNANRPVGHHGYQHGQEPSLYRDGYGQEGYGCHILRPRLRSARYKGRAVSPAHSPDLRHADPAYRHWLTAGVLRRWRAAPCAVGAPCRRRVTSRHTPPAITGGAPSAR